jgi:site-specific recombinase XerD
MGFIRKRKLPSGKIRWQVIWDADVAEAGAEIVDRPRMTAMFDTHAEAKTKLASVELEKPKPSAPFTDLTKHFLDYFEQLVKKGQREATTLRQFKQHINLHILVDQQIAQAKCGDIDAVFVQLFIDRLGKRVSPKMAVKVRGTLSRLFDHGMRRGFVKANPVGASKIEVTHRPEAGAEEHFYLPPKDDLRTLLGIAKRIDNTGRADAAIHLLMFGGLRMSEFRGLWKASCELEPNRAKVKIVRRADFYNELGSVKSAASLRTIEIGNETAASIRNYLDSCVVNSDLVFPNEEGNVWNYPNFWHRFWVPLMNAAGLVTDEPASKTVREWSEAQADFKQPAFGPHTLRHVYASLQIEQGVTPKVLQKLMGHATLKLTLDTYGHLWPDENADRARARAVETAL